MEFAALYKCLCDPCRLRILNLLNEGPLCVCHLMEVLEFEQVKVSKQLRYMKQLGIVEGERRAQWMVYRIPGPENRLLRKNLECLREDPPADLPLAEDLNQRALIMKRLEAETLPCLDLA